MPSSERSSENRRVNKPVMEKKRRARINNCLNQLKGLVLEGMKKDPARHSKLEKADILEMAVKHMKSLNSSRPSSGAGSRFQEGYADCARQVASYLNSHDQMDLELKQRLMVHLASAYRPPSTAIAPAPAPAAAASVTTVTAAAPAVLSSLQLVPTVLPSGEVGYIIQPQQQQRQALVTSPTPRRDVAAPLSVSTCLQQQQQQSSASIGSPSPAPSSPAAAESSGWDEPRSPASPSSVGSYGSGSVECSRTETPQPLDLVAHTRGMDDACWRPW